MSSFQALRFNWLPQRSLYADAQAWNQRRQSLKLAEEYQASISDGMANAASDQLAGMVNIAAKKALQRTQAAATAKVNAVLHPVVDEAPKKTDTSDLTLPDGTTIKTDPTIYLPGGSKLNLNTGTLILPNGTAVDTATGARKVNVTV